MAREPYFLAVLDTMWGAHGRRAPHWFQINPHNHSGRRLYRLTGASVGHLWVTNACPVQTGHARAHGTPSAEWLFESMSRVRREWCNAPLIVCGQVAQRTFDELIAHYGLPSTWHDGPVLRMKHPAARTWTAQELARVARRLHTIV